jgi:hypothetical protein
MSGEQDKEGNTDQDLSRRNVLKRTASVGIISSIGGRATGSSKTSSTDIDDILDSEPVRRIISEIPGLELNLDQAFAIGENESLIIVPANYGKLVTTPLVAGESRLREYIKPQKELAASFYFNEWVESVHDDWPQGTVARLTATDDGVVLQRSATDAEKRTFLKGIKRSDLLSKNISVGVIPDRGKAFVMHANRKSRELEMLEIAVNRRSSQSQITTDSSISLEVRNKTVYDGSNSFGTQSISTTSTSASACEKIPFDLIYCIVTNAPQCLACTIGSPAPPVLGACLLIVCLNAGLAIVEEVLSDIGCLSAGQNSVACAKKLINKYGDQIPEPPDPDPPELPFW